MKLVREVVVKVVVKVVVESENALHYCRHLRWFPHPWESVYDNGRGCIGGNRILGICRDSCDLLVDVSNGGSVSGGGGGGGLFVLE